MQIQHHIHETSSELWPRCKFVEAKEGLLYCDLAVQRQYDLVAAYPKAPHIQFMNCDTVEDLRAFTQAWGPLYLVVTGGNEDMARGKAIRRIDEIQAHRRWLRAVKGLIDACRGSSEERAALCEFLSAEVDLDRTSSTFSPGQAPFFHATLQLVFGYRMDSIAWAASVDLKTVRKALAYTVEMNVHAPGGSLKVEEQGKGFEIKPRFSLTTLWDALQWMVWLDEWNHWPPSACQECHKIFAQVTAHERKYCSPACAHRATNRAWRRRDLHKRKKNPRRQKG